MNSKLQKVLEPPAIWVYTDGSASVHGQKTGSYAAMILAPDRPPQFVTGTSNWTKVNRQELTAINSALYWVQAIFHDGYMAPCRINIITDSTYVEQGAIDPSRRKANRDLWAQYEELSRPYDVCIQHMPRNQEPAQAQADAMCDLLRDLFEEWVQKLDHNESFRSMQLTRTTKL